MVKKLKDFFDDCIQAFKIIYFEHYTYRASALAFVTLLSLVPMISVFVYIITQFEIFSKTKDIAKNYIINEFVLSSSEQITAYLERFAEQTSHLPVYSGIFLFIVTILLVITIEDSIIAIWQKEVRKRNIEFIIIYPLLVIFIPFVIGLCALLGSFLFLVFNHLPGFIFISFIAPFLINTVIFTFLYFITTDAKIKWHNAFIGAIVAAFLVELAKFIFYIYTKQYSYYTEIYGALASIPIFLVWLYIFWMIILYGAIVARLRFQRIDKK